MILIRQTTVCVTTQSDDKVGASGVGREDPDHQHCYSESFLSVQTGIGKNRAGDSAGDSAGKGGRGEVSSVGGSRRDI